jgi:hypothetical protein
MQKDDHQIQEKARYASKGSTIRQAGFETGIHALPPEIKNELDTMLKQRFPPNKVLRHLSEKYPGQPLPSKSALYNYRRRYFEQSLVSERGLIRQEEKLDLEKVGLKGAILDHIKRFVALDLPALREQWVKSLEKDTENGFISKETRDIGKLYMEALKLSLDAVPKFNIRFEIEETTKIKVEKPAMSPEEIDDMTERLLATRGYQIALVTARNKSERTGQAYRVIETGKSS